MASRGLPPVVQPGMRAPATPESREPGRDFAPPPPHEVVWVVADRQDPARVASAFAQTAYRAHELAGLARDGRRLAYSDVEVTISESLTRERFLAALLDFLAALGARPSPVPWRGRRKRKQNGSSNGKG